MKVSGIKTATLSSLFLLDYCASFSRRFQESRLQRYLHFSCSQAEVLGAQNVFRCGSSCIQISLDFHRDFDIRSCRINKIHDFLAGDKIFRCFFLLPNGIDRCSMKCLNDKARCCVLYFSRGKYSYGDEGNHLSLAAAVCVASLCGILHDYGEILRVLEFLEKQKNEIFVGHVDARNRVAFKSDRCNCKLPEGDLS